MSTVITNPSPKQRFQETVAHITAHRDLIQSPAFTRAADLALLQYQGQLCLESGDLNTAAAKHLRMQGALEFLQTFRMLSESPSLPSTNRVANLDHKA